MRSEVDVVETPRRRCAVFYAAESTWQARRGRPRISRTPRIRRRKCHRRAHPDRLTAPKSRFESRRRREPVKARRSGPFESRGKSLWDQASMARRAAMSIAEHGFGASAARGPQGPALPERIDVRTRCAAKPATSHRSADGADLRVEEGGSRPPSRCDGPSPRSALTPGLLKGAPIRPSRPWFHPR